jgi:hypothetical protein
MNISVRFCDRFLAYCPYFGEKNKDVYEMTLLCPHHNVAGQRLGKHIPAITNWVSLIERMLESLQ